MLTLVLCIKFVIGLRLLEVVERFSQPLSKIKINWM
jgi:hypothetical protein